MIRSMTGYGKGENISEGKKFTVEIKAVNHRYNELSIKLPRSMNYMEDKIRKELAQNITRGKTDVYINLDAFASDTAEIRFNESLADAYIEKINYMEEKYGIKANDKIALAAKFPDVLSNEKADEDEDVLWSILYPALKEAIIRFLEMRETEGITLKNDILLKSETIKSVTDDIKKRSPFVAEDYRKKLTDRLAELLGTVGIAEERIISEVTVFADRCCIDEEITRLYSHIEQLEAILKRGGSVGRKLDFLVQEMNREANTIASKSNDIEITRSAIELKSEIEKIREQVQNIE